MRGHRIGSLLVGALAAASCLAGPAGQHTKTHVRLGTISVGAGYSYRYSVFPTWYGWPSYYGWPLYDWCFLPVYYPGYYSGYAAGPRMGAVQLRTPTKDAAVLLDGAYAGRAGDLKTMWLEPGAYNLEVRSGASRFSQRIYVLSGKTLKIDTAGPPVSGDLHGPAPRSEGRP